jgi:hypothetical protein
VTAAEAIEAVAIAVLLVAFLVTGRRLRAARHDLERERATVRSLDARLVRMQRIVHGLEDDVRLGVLN